MPPYIRKLRRVIEAYKIGISLLLESNASKEIGVLGVAFEDLDKIIKNVQRDVTELATTMRGLGRIGKSVAASWNDVAAAINRAAKAMPSGAGGFAAPPSGGGSVPYSSGLGRVPAALTAPGGPLSLSYGGGGGGGSGPPSPFYGYPRGGPGGSPLLLGGPGGGSGMPPLNMPPGANPRTPYTASHGDYMMTFMAAGAASAGIMDGLKNALEKGMDVEHLRAILGTDKRLSPAEIQAGMDVAYNATKSAPGSTYSGNVGALLDLKTLTGSLEEAQKMLPEFAQLETVLNTVQKARTGSDDPIYAAAKAMEILGKLTKDELDPKTGKERAVFHPEELPGLIDKIMRVDVATGGRVDPAQILAFAKMGAVPGMMMSDKFLWEEAPALMQVMGGSRFGTAMMSMFQVVDGERMTKKTYEAMARLGLATPWKKAVPKIDPKTGKLDTSEVQTGGVYDSDLMFSDPIAWMHKAQDRMEKAGIHGSSAQIKALTGPASQRSTYARLLADMLKDLPAIEKEAENIRSVRPDAVKYLQDNDPNMKLAKFQASLEKFLAMLGGPLMDPAIKMLDTLSAKMAAMADWEKEHPVLTKIGGEGLGYGGMALGALSALGLGSMVIKPGISASKGIWSALSGLFDGAAAGSAAGAAAGGGAKAAGGLGVAFLSAIAIKGALESGSDAVEDLIFGKGHSKKRRDLLETGNPLMSSANAAEPTPVKMDTTSSNGIAANVANAVKSALIGISVSLDGKKVGEIIAGKMADNMSRPPTGTSAPDIRMSPWMPGLIGLN